MDDRTTFGMLALNEGREPMWDHNARNSKTRLGTRRPGKAGVIIILILAAAVGGGVYAWKTGMIGGSKDATPVVAPPAATSADALGTSAAPAGANPSAPKSGTKGPSSIFDYSGTGGSSGTSSAQPSTPLPPSVIAPPTPAAPPVADVNHLESVAREADKLAAQLHDQAIAKLKGTPQFSAKQAEVDRLEGALKTARLSGTAQEKLDASGAWNKARIALDREYDAVLLHDPAYAASRAAVDKAAAELRAARALKPAATPTR
jgi:hypothetical protein